MKRQRKFWALLFLFAALMAAPGPGRAEEEEILPVLDPMSTFIFPEHLNEANAEIISASGESRRGIWEQDQFQFYGLDSSTKIAAVSGTSVSGETAWQAIQMNTVPKRTRKLQFLNTPTGQQMVLYYRILPQTEQEPAAKPEGESAYDKSKAAPKQNVYFYFNVFAGKKLIKKIRVSTQDTGWKKDSVDFKILSLLNRNFPLTFTLSGSETISIPFQFSAEIYQ